MKTKQEQLNKECTKEMKGREKKGRKNGERRKEEGRAASQLTPTSLSKMKESLPVRVRNTNEETTTTISKTRGKRF